jgi:hypothetical protein
MGEVKSGRYTMRFCSRVCTASLWWSSLLTETECSWYSSTSTLPPLAHTARLSKRYTRLYCVLVLPTEVSLSEMDTCGWMAAGASSFSHCPGKIPSEPPMVAWTVRVGGTKVTTAPGPTGSPRKHSGSCRSPVRAAPRLEFRPCFRSLSPSLSTCWCWSMCLCFGWRVDCRRRWLCSSPRARCRE